MRNIKFPDPFRWLCDGHRKGALVLSLTLCLVLLMVMQALDGPLKTEAAPHGIISYELAKTPSVAQRILASWSQDAKIHAAFSLGIDYLFLSDLCLLYRTGMCTTWSDISRQVAENGHGRFYVSLGTVFGCTV